MTGNPEPTFEELQFVYNLISKGVGDSEILAEYARLKEADLIEFPLRTDLAFLEARRKEFSAAERVIKSNSAKTIDPQIETIKTGHFDRLSEIIRVLLEEIPENDLIGKSGDNPQLARELEENLFNATIIYGEWEVKYQLIVHLQAESPEFEQIKNFLNQQPHEYVRKLREIAKRGTFKGICHECNS